jgi:uncharacterized membrane protein YqjE
MRDPTNSGDADASSSPGSGIASGLFHSITQFVASLIALTQTRLELLTTELQEEIQRVASLAIYAFVALLAAMLGLFFGGLAIVMVYWDTHRVLAASLVTLTFLTIAVVAVLILMAKVRAQPPILDATLNELKKDAAQLRERL